MISNSEKRIKTLELWAAKMRRNVVDICMQCGGYAGQGVALSDVGAPASISTRCALMGTAGTMTGL